MIKRLFLILFFAFVINAQITKDEIYHNSDLEIYFYAALLDSGTVVSPYFDLSKFNGNSFLSYPLVYTYETDSLSGDAIYSIFVERKFTNHGAEVVDTIAISDTASVSLTSGVLDLNNMKSADYRVKVVTTSANGATYNLKLTFYAYKED